MLDRVGISLVRAPGAGCCGALAYHLNARAPALDTMRRLIDAWWPSIEAGAEAIVITASGCGAMVNDYGHALGRDPAYADKAKRVSELHRDISVGGLAGHVGASERSLLRHFRSHYGASPIAHIQRLRVERAKALLETTHLSFEEIVERCGYTDASSFRKLFKRATTLTPADYRHRFALRAQ